MKILAIDTSCDDTSIAVADELNIIANISWAKIKTHAKWGGVVPSEARRQHSEFLDPAISEALEVAKLKAEDIDAIAVTYGPGLAIALEAGITKAKELAIKYNKPLIAVNHMIGHIYSSLARDEKGSSYSGLNDFDFPLLALAISGGHTDLYIMNGHLQFTQIGQTLDDAAGEAFDKVGRMLGMDFPAGAKIEEAAANGNPKAFDFPRPLSNSGDFNWSFSGLKTAVLYQVRKLVGDYDANPTKKQFKLEDASEKLSDQQIADIAASFQQAAIDSITIKIAKAIEKYSPKMLVVGGGVIANSHLRDALENVCNNSGIKLYYPKPLWLCVDNASMIATAGYFYAKAGKYCKEIEKLDRDPSLRITS